MGRRSRGAYAVTVLALAGFLNNADKSVMIAVTSNVQKEFGLSDAQLGLLGSAFGVVLAIGAVPFAFWADRRLRRSVIAFGVGLWSLTTLFSGIAVNYTQLLLARAGVGIGEAGFVPAGTSLLSDLYSKHSRGRAMAVFQTVWLAGFPVGLAGGGVIAAIFGWRTAFFAAAIPGLILAAFALFLPEPARGAAEVQGPRLYRASDANPRTFLALLRIPTLAALIVSSSFSSFLVIGLVWWIPTFLNRQYGLDSGQAGALLGLPLAAGGVIGTLAGGWFIDWRSLQSDRAYIELILVSTLLGVVPQALVFVAPNPLTFGLLFFVAGFLLSVANPAATAVTQNIVIPSMRASANTWTDLVPNLVGAASPLAFGALSDSLHDLRLALLLPVPVLLLASCAPLIPALRTVERDTLNMQEAWAARTSEGEVDDPDERAPVAG